MVSSTVTDSDLARGGAAPAEPRATRAIDSAGVWRRALEVLEHDPAISRATFSSWLAGSRLLAGQGRDFLIGAQHSFARQKLERSFAEPIRQALARATGRADVRTYFAVTPREPGQGAQLLAQAVTQQDGLIPPVTGAALFEPAVSPAPDLAGPETHDMVEVVGASIMPASEAPVASAPPATLVPLTQPPAPISVVEPSVRPTPAALVEAPAIRTPVAAEGWRSGLDVSLRFASFAQGKSNQFALAAARAVAGDPGVAYNPLYIYGASGLGKTHLLHAIGNQIEADWPQTRVLYVTSRGLAREMAGAHRTGQVGAAHARYASAGVLLLDDVQYLADPAAYGLPAAGVDRAGAHAEATVAAVQAEIGHLVNALLGVHRQVVLAADRPPRALDGLDPQIRSRFQMGLVADVAYPDRDTRCAILRARAHTQRVALPPTVVDLIASRVTGSVRELEGALNRILASVELAQMPLTLDSVEGTLDQMQLLVSPAAPRQARVTPAQILGAIASAYDVSIEALQGKRRDQEIVAPRQVAMFLLREETPISLNEIGALLGGRDHSTVLHGYEKIAGRLANDLALQNQVEGIRRSLGRRAPLAAVH